MADTLYSTSTVPPWVQPYSEGFLQQAWNVAQQPYQPYGGATVAPLTNYQQQGYDAMAQRAMQGSPLTSTANSVLQQQMTQPGQTAATNPYGNVSPMWNPMGSVSAMQNPYGNVGATMNPYGYVTPQANPYAGSNPYLPQMIGQAQQDTVNSYNTAVKPQTEAAMVNSGSFGNSGLMQMQQQQQSDLQRNLGNISSGLRFQDYGLQAQLGEAAANRGLQAGMANQQVGGQYATQALQAALANQGMGQNYANNALQAALANQNMGQQYSTQALQAALANQGMGENYAGRQDTMARSNAANLYQALSMAPAMAQQDYYDIAQLLGAGQGLQTQNQAGLTDAYNRFLESRGYPVQQLDIMRSALGGNYGQQTTQQVPGTSPLASGLGGALTGLSLYDLLTKLPGG